MQGAGTELRASFFSILNPRPSIWRAPVAQPSEILAAHNGRWLIAKR